MPTIDVGSCISSLEDSIALREDMLDSSRIRHGFGFDYPIGKATPYRGFARMNADPEGKTLPLIALMTLIVKELKAKGQKPRAKTRSSTA